VEPSSIAHLTIPRLHSMQTPARSDRIGSAAPTVPHESSSCPIERCALPHLLWSRSNFRAHRPRRPSRACRGTIRFVFSHSLTYALLRADGSGAQVWLHRGVGRARRDGEAFTLSLIRAVPVFFIYLFHALRNNSCFLLPCCVAELPPHFWLSLGSSACF
jgi:hypothetical protein